MSEAASKTADMQTRHAVSTKQLGSMAGILDLMEAKPPGFAVI